MYMVKSAKGLTGVGITIFGFEDVCKKEIESFGAKEVKTSKGFVKFIVNDELELSKIAYKSQTTSRIINPICELAISRDIINAEKDVIGELKRINISNWLKKGKTFKVECERDGDHEFTSSVFESLLGRLIIESVEKGYDFTPKVSMDNPDIIIYTNIRDGICIFGVDYCGFDMSKRDYHIFVNKISIRGVLGACLALYADMKPKKTVLDTFSSSGTIVIETALLSDSISPNFFRKEEFMFRRFDALKETDWEAFFKKIDKKIKSKNFKIIATDPLLANIRSTTKNAKIAGVQKSIAASRVDIEWLDTKIDKSSVDTVITRLPSVSRSNPEKDIEKLYKEFFYQLEYLLKKDGNIIIIMSEKDIMVNVAKKYKFIEESVREIMVGKMPLKVITLKKSG